MCTADAALPMKEAELTETILQLLKDEHTLPEIKCNTLTLTKAICTSGNLDLVCCLVTS